MKLFTYMIRIFILHNIVVMGVIMSSIDIICNLDVRKYEFETIFGEPILIPTNTNKIWQLLSILTCNSSDSSLHVSALSFVIELDLVVTVSTTGWKASGSHPVLDVLVLLLILSPCNPVWPCTWDRFSCKLWRYIVNLN